MEDLVIELSFNPENFREIYYTNGQSYLFTHKPTRSLIVIAILSALLTVAVYFLSFRFPGISWLIGLGLLATFSLTVYAIMAIVKFARWKRATESFLKDLSQYNSYKILATDNSIQVNLDTKTTIDRWSNIKSARIKENYILLYNETGPFYIFPAKSMKQEEFNQLKELVKTKVR